jgi:nucleotide-binding universal stress UspA family protein
MWTSKNGSPNYAAAAPKQFAPENLRSSRWRGSRPEVSRERGVHMSRDSAPGNAGVVAAPRGNVVVVGHDASEGADLALTTALELASRMRSPVMIVRTWSVATAPRPPGWDVGYIPSLDEMSEAVHDDLVRDVWASIQCFPMVAVECRAVHAPPAKGLIDASGGTRMLVVGCRGLGGVASMVGSVSDQCVRHATCDVLVVRPREQGRSSVNAGGDRERR